MLPLSCGCGGSPSQPSGPRVDTITQTLAQKVLRVHVDSNGRVSVPQTFSVFPGNTQIVEPRITRVSIRVEGYDNCPEQFAASVILPSGKHVPVWAFEPTLPCPNPAPGPGQRRFDVIVYKEGEMTEFVSESAFGNWTITGAGQGNRTSNEIRVIMDITHTYQSVVNQ